MIGARTLGCFCRILQKPQTQHLQFRPILALTKFQQECVVVSSNRYYAREKQKIDFDFSGDLIPKSKTDGSELFFPYKELGDLKNLEEPVRRLCSLEFCDGRQRVYHKEYELMKKVEEFCGPNSELEKKIVKATLHIRSMLPYCMSRTTDKRSKSLLVERIAKRKKFLKELRAVDYENFIWLLKELKIRYIPAKKTFYVTKKQKRLNENQGAADKIKNEKLEEIKLAFEKEKEEYLLEKQRILEEIEKEMEEYGLDKNEILNSAEEVRVARETPPEPVRTKFASLRDWSLPKVPLRFYRLK